MAASCGGDDSDREDGSDCELWWRHLKVGSPWLLWQRTDDGETVGDEIRRRGDDLKMMVKWRGVDKGR